MSFCGNTKITSVTLPGTILLIENRAFETCFNLSKVILPEGLRQINQSAFRSCKALKEAKLPSTMATMQGAVFENTALEYVEIPAMLSIADSPFDGSNIRYITFDPKCTQIVSNLFCDCDALESVVIPEGITSINSFAFALCNNLTDVTLPSTLKSITNLAFMDCPKLKNVVFSEELTSIGSAFRGCSELAELNLPSSLQSISPKAFKGTAIESIKIPASLTIGANAFEDSPLKEATFAEGSTTIVDSLFCNCTTLEKVDIPNSMTSIGVSAFEYCSVLPNLVIPESVAHIGETAFQNCSSMADLAILNPECEIFDAESTIAVNSTIYGYRNSTAEAYAKKYHRTFIAIDRNLEYDFNADGAFSVADIVLYPRVLAEDSTLHASVCDVNGDEILTILDVSKLLGFLRAQQMIPEYINDLL